MYIIIINNRVVINLLNVGISRQATTVIIRWLSLSNAPISPRIVLVPIVPDPFFGDQSHFCENSRESASTVEHYTIPWEEDLARSPQSLKGQVPK